MAFDVYLIADSSFVRTVICPEQYIALQLDSSKEYAVLRANPPKSSEQLGYTNDHPKN